MTLADLQLVDAILKFVRPRWFEPEDGFHAASVDSRKDPTVVGDQTERDVDARATGDGSRLLAQMVQRFYFIGLNIFGHEKIGKGVEANQRDILSRLGMFSNVVNEDR